MVPPVPKEDYYAALGIEQHATVEEIQKSYKRLAFKLHPDRNSCVDATVKFQQLSEAYEFLKNENKRRDYDMIYPSIIKSPGASQSRQHTTTTTTTPHSVHQAPTPQQAPDSCPGSGPQRTSNQRPDARSSSASGSSSEANNDAVLIGKLREAKAKRQRDFQAKQNTQETRISPILKSVSESEQKIQSLRTADAEDKVQDAWHKGWGAWVLNLTERLLETQKAQLEKEVNRFAPVLESYQKANDDDDARIAELECRMALREARERKKERIESERLERERLERDMEAVEKLLRHLVVEERQRREREEVQKMMRAYNLKLEEEERQRRQMEQVQRQMRAYNLKLEEEKRQRREWEEVQKLMRAHSSKLEEEERQRREQFISAVRHLFYAPSSSAYPDSATPSFTTSQGQPRIIDNMRPAVPVIRHTTTAPNTLPQFAPTNISGVSQGDDSFVLPVGPPTPCSACGVLMNSMIPYCFGIEICSDCQRKIRR